MTNRNLASILMVCLLFYSIEVEASDMAGVGLFFMVIVAFGLIAIAVLCALLLSRKIGLYIICVIDSIFLIQFLLARSHEWRRLDDISAMNILYAQGLILAMLSLIQYLRYARTKGKLADD